MSKDVEEVDISTALSAAALGVKEETELVSRGRTTKPKLMGPV